MAKLFKSLFKGLNELSDDELKTHIGEIRRRKYIERASSVRRVEKAAKPATTRKVTSVTKLFGTLSEAERIALLAQLEQGE